MNDSLRSFCSYLKDSLEQVSRKEWCFFLVLNALHCLVRPYWGITHDAKLYAVQVMNRAKEGFFDEDLFFRYGSQDSYSVFSALMAPLVSWLGLSWSFFVVYVASVALLIFAEIRLVRALVPDRTAGNVALVLLAVADLPWGGWGVLHVHESFLTPRLPAAALTLWGLEQLLRKRFVSASALMLAAMALHPLMAIGGLVLAVAASCVARLSSRAVMALGLTTALAAAVVLLCQPLGIRLFGYIDSEWHDVVRRRCPYSFPAAWPVMGWFWIAYSLAVVVVGCRYLDRHRATVMRLVILLALAGVAGSVAAEAYPYALLLQGQPHRVLWLLQLLALPLGVLVTFRLWQKGTVAARLGSAFVFCFTTRLLLPNTAAVESITSTLTIWASLLVLFAIIFSRVRSRNRPGKVVRAGWLWPSLLASLGATGLLLSLIDAVAFCLGGSGKTSPVWSLWLAPSMCSDAVLALAGILLVAGLWSAARDVRRAGLAAAAVWVGFSVTVFFFQQERGGWDPFTKNRADVSFVRQFVHEHWPERARAPSVYWPTEPNHVWFDIPAHSFFSWPQTAGVAFSRGTAMEGQRRALLVRKFEITEMRQLYAPDAFWDFCSGFYQATIDEPGPTRRDLIALCKEEELDFVVLSRAFKDLAAGTNGSVFVYDCRSIRNRFEPVEHMAVSLAGPPGRATAGRRFKKSGVPSSGPFRELPAGPLP